MSSARCEFENQPAKSNHGLVESNHGVVEANHGRSDQYHGSVRLLPFPAESDPVLLDVPVMNMLTITFAMPYAIAFYECAKMFTERWKSMRRITNGD